MVQAGDLVTGGDVVGVVKENGSLGISRLQNWKKSHYPEAERMRPSTSLQGFCIRKSVLKFRYLGSSKSTTSWCPLESRAASTSVSRVEVFCSTKRTDFSV